MIQFIVIDLYGEIKPLKIQQLSWEEHSDGKLRLHFHGIGLEEKYSDETPGIISGFCDDGEDSGWLLCQVIKGTI